VQLGRSLGFSTDGGRAAIASADGVHLVDVSERRPPMFRETPKIADIAAVGAQLWVATLGPSPRLLRFAPDGTIRGDATLWGTSGLLRACAVGAPAAVWSESPPAIVPESGDAVPIAVTPEPDAIIPVSTTRWVTCKRDRVTLRDPGTQRWAVTVNAPGRVVDGAVLFDGRTIALVFAVNETLVQLVVLGLHDGAIHHRLTLQGIDLVRFAPARGYALLRSEAHTLVLFDLRFGRVFKEHREERPVLDAAIDNAGHAFMMRFGDAHDDIAIGTIRALFAEPSPQVPVPANEEVPAVEAPTLPIALETAPDVPFHVGNVPLTIATSLAPRSEPKVLPATEAVAILESYRTLVAALTGHAIATAWDQGRLSIPTESGLPFKAEVAGLLGRSGGRAPNDVAEAEAHMFRALATTRAAEGSLSADTPLAALASEFQLSSTAQLVLLVAAAPALWGELARLYGILANDEGRALVDELMISTILGPHASHYDVARELDRDSPLVRHGLLHFTSGKPRPFTAITVDTIVVRLLRGADCEADLDDVRVVSQFRPFAELLIPAEIKDNIATRVAEAAATGRGRVVVRGRTGSGRHAILSTLASAAGRWLGVIDATMIVRDPKRRLDDLRIALRRAALLGLLPCVDGLEAIPSDDAATRDLVRAVLDDHPGPLAVRLPWDAEPPLAAGYLSIDLPPLSMEQRTQTWRTLLDEHGLHVRDPDELADRYRVGPGVIARACVQVAARSIHVSADGENGEKPDSSLALETAIRQHLESRLKATAVRVDRLASWSRVILPPDIQESVLELIARIKHRRTVYDQWGMGEIVTTARGVTALFQGGPGTGKTLVASAIANELGMDLYRVDLSRIMSKWIGETEQNLAKLFDAAEDGHAIVLFDEADSLFAKRTEVRTSVDRYANLEVNYLLQRLDTFEGIAILTTNFGTSIDNAFKRRLSFRLTFPFPDEDAREALWRSHLPAQLPKVGTFDLAELARKYRLSGGYIRNAALRAAFLAAEEHSPLTQDHLERAIKAEFREIGKIAESGILE
jgi:ATPase family associated with various cellular activities (AAA)/Winged helix domain, variant